ncbi:MAG: LacI family DNA-binding transcriptional regulator [Thermaerobacter sp.]|nr:LacI family DNA-binding transcriptional regulator [Thermaerobacter sp.]
MPTIKDVAKMAGVSPATVSAVLRGNKRVSDISREKVDAAIAATGYRPNVVARSLRTRQTRTLGLIVPDISNPFYPEIARGIEQTARRHGFDVLFATGGEDFVHTQHLLWHFTDRQVDGIILTSIGLDYPLSVAEWGVPIILVNRKCRGCTTDFIGIDNRAAARDVIHYLISEGHQDIAFVGGPGNSSASLGRLQGYREAMLEAGLDLFDDWLLSGQLRYEDGVRAAHRLVSSRRRPTAIFSADDMMALGILDGLEQRHVEVPREMSVVGFDGIWTSSLHGVQLTTVSQPLYEMGARSTEQLLKRLDGDPSPPVDVLLDYTLVIRKTTGPAPPR